MEAACGDPHLGAVAGAVDRLAAAGEDAVTWKGWEDFTPATSGANLSPRPAVPKRSKYHAQRTEVDGLTFDSKREAARYQVLKARMAAGDVRRLKCQPRYALCPLIIEHGDVRNINAGSNSPRRYPVVEYIADFEYEERDSAVAWNLVVEDVKGVRTDLYKLKKRWFEAQYGMTIREV